MEFSFSFEIENKFRNFYVKNIEHRMRSATTEMRALGALKLVSKTSRAR